MSKNITNAKALVKPHSLLKDLGGARRDRTDGLLNANQALSQLSYGPSKNNGGPG